jgi:DNA-3-methyladenine glycosylase II
MKNKAIMQLQNADERLKNIIMTVSEPTFETTNDVFHDLMSCVLEQQIHYRSTKQIFQKMLKSANIERLTLDNFSEFEKTAFANSKLAISKFETMEHIIDFFASNKINWALLSDTEVVEKLSSIKGIGKWTIDMILLYTLERSNVFPYDDFHLKKIMEKLYGLNPNVKLKTQMLDIAESWGEHKSLAVKYLFAWKEYNTKKL